MLCRFLLVREIFLVFVNELAECKGGLEGVSVLQGKLIFVNVVFYF